MVVFGQRGCNRAKWMYLGKYGFIRVNWLYSGKIDGFGKKRLY